MHWAGKVVNWKSRGKMWLKVGPVQPTQCSLHWLRWWKECWIISQYSKIWEFNPSKQRKQKTKTNQRKQKKKKERKYQKSVDNLLLLKKWRSRNNGFKFPNGKTSHMHCLFSSLLCWSTTHVFYNRSDSPALCGPCWQGHFLFSVSVMIHFTESLGFFQM